MTITNPCVPRIVNVPLADHWVNGNFEKLTVVEPAKVIYGAIAISSHSEFDRCWIVPQGRVPGRPQPPLVNLSIERLIGEGAFLVSAQRPWCGTIEGPFSVLAPYATTYFRGASAGFERVTPITEFMVSDLNGSGIAGVGRLPQLILDLHPSMPPWLATARAPRDYVFLAADFGTSSTKRFRIPTYGRSYTSIALEMTGYTSGTLRVAITGYRGLGFPINGTFEIGEALLTATDFTADFERIYEVTAEFDFIDVQLTEQAAMGASALVGIVVVTRD